MEYTLEQSQAYELAMLYKAIVGLKDASNEEFFDAVSKKDEYLSNVWNKE